MITAWVSTIKNDGPLLCNVGTFVLMTTPVLRSMRTSSWPRAMSSQFLGTASTGCARRIVCGSAPVPGGGRVCGWAIWRCFATVTATPAVAINAATTAARRARPVRGSGRSFGVLYPGVLVDVDPLELAGRDRLTLSAPAHHDSCARPLRRGTNTEQKVPSGSYVRALRLRRSRRRHVGSITPTPDGRRHPRSRDRTSHLLVHAAFAGPACPAPDRRLRCVHTRPGSATPEQRDRPGGAHSRISAFGRIGRTPPRHPIFAA